MCKIAEEETKTCTETLNVYKTLEKHREGTLNLNVKLVINKTENSEENLITDINTTSNEFG